jgi:uncharacterized OB-fold protein
VLKLQQCSDCGTNRFYPRHTCPKCGSSSVKWVDATGNGTIFSLTTVHRGPSAAFKERQPYIVALIDLPEGVRMMSNIVGESANQAKIGDPVLVRFEARGEISMPVFERQL